MNKEKNKNHKQHIDWHSGFAGGLGLGYAGLYKGYAKHVNEIPEEELTITIFRATAPRKLFSMWRESHREIELTAPGVYLLKGLKDVSVYTEPGDRQDANAVLMISSLANEDMYNRLYEEDDDMRNVLQEIMKDDLEEMKKNSYDFGYNSGFNKGAQEERQKNEARINELEAEIKRLQQLIPTAE